MNNEELNKIHRISLIAKGQGAFLGAAVGDALGWPQEPEAKRVDKRITSPAESLSNGFQQWTRKSGGQYYPHEEIVLAGEYSDDTQLILCTARSLFYGKKWWQHLTKYELPTWTCYERGGGGATKRAAKEWLNGIEPWSSYKNQNQYFQAGGNGVAMRILPHCLLGAKDKDFRSIAKNIVINGVCTHGHPRALVGALAYGFAVWIAFRETGTLPYGTLIDQVMSEIDFWSELPDLDDTFPTWKPSAKEVNAGRYKQHWRESIEEMLQLLMQCQQAMKQGALSVERELMTNIGCFDKRVKGSGTVSAAAAIFLASRYAADPLHGLLEAAFAHDADTDTIASMTGGILGAIAGIEWLGDYVEKVQDAKYIQSLSTSLAENRIKEIRNNYQTKEAEDNKNKKASIDYFIEKIEQARPKDNILLPDGRDAKILIKQNHHSLSKSTIAVSWKIITNDGQSLYVKKVSPKKNEPNGNLQVSGNEQRVNNLVGMNFQPVKVSNITVKIPVKNLRTARLFYEKVLGIQVEKESEVLVKCGDIVLVMQPEPKKSGLPLTDSFSSNLTTTICIEVESLDPAHNNVSKSGFKILQPISEKRGRRFFTCLDPDENAVEIYEIAF